LKLDRLLGVLIFVWAISAVSLGALWYLTVGLPVKILGYIWLFIAGALATANWILDTQPSWAVVILIILGIIGAIAVILQDEGEDETESDTLNIDLNFNRWHEGRIKGTIYFWIGICLIGFSIFSYVNFLWQLIQPEMAGYVLTSVFSAQAITLLFLKISGGKKGKLWENVKQAVTAGGNLVTAPRPL